MNEHEQPSFDERQESSPQSPTEQAVPAEAVGPAAPGGPADPEPQVRIGWDAGESAVVSPPAAPPPRPYPFWGWLDALILAGLVLIGIVAASVFVAVIGAILAVAGGAEAAGPLGGLSMAQGAVAIQLFGFGAALAGLAALFRLRYQTSLFRALQLRKLSNSPQFVIFAFAGLATALFVAVLGAALRIQDMDMPMNEFIKSDTDLLLIGIAAFTFGPLFEELIFRGFLQPLLSKVFGVALGILTTSLLFALPHGPQYGWHWQHLLIIVVAGSVFGLIRWKAQSTTASTIAHATYNGFLILVTVYQRMAGLA